MKWTLVFIVAVLLFCTTYFLEEPPTQNTETQTPVLSTQEQSTIDTINQWSEEADVVPPNVVFQYGEFMYTGYNQSGKYGEYESAATYEIDTNTITFRREQISLTMMRHEFIHYLQDLLGGAPRVKRAGKTSLRVVARSHSGAIIK